MQTKAAYILLLPFTVSLWQFSGQWIKILQIMPRCSHTAADTASESCTKQQMVQIMLCHSSFHKSKRRWSCWWWRQQRWAPLRSSAAPSNRELPVTAVRLRICHCGSLCCVVQDWWITGDILTLQFGVLLWAPVTGWTNSPRILSLCLFHPDIQFSATRPHWSLRAAKRARGANERDRYYKH